MNFQFKGLLLLFFLTFSKFAAGQSDSLLDYGSQLIEEELRFEDARQVFYQALQQNQDQDNQKGISMSYYLLARSFYYQDNMVLALRYFQQSEEVDRQNGEQSTDAPVYIAIGTIYDHLGDYSLAMTYHQKALARAKQGSNPYYQAIIYNNMAESYFNVMQLDSALLYCKQALVLYQKNERSQGISDCYLLLGRIALSNKDFILHKQFLGKAQEIITSTRDFHRYPVLNIEFGKYYSQINAFDSAFWHYTQADYYADSLNNLKMSLTSHKELALLSEERGDSKKALYHLKEFQQIQDSLTHIQDALITNELAARFDSKKKEREISSLNKNNEQKDAELKVQQLRIQWISILLLLVGLFTALIYVLYDRARKAKKVIEEKNEQIVHLVQEIHHRVKNNLQVVSGILKLQSKQSISPEAKAILQEGQNRMQAMALIHERLYQKNTLNQVNLKDYLTELSRSIQMLVVQPQQQVKMELDVEEIWLDIDLAVPIGLIANELVTNAFKHGFRGGINGRIKVSAHTIEKGSYEFVIENDGIKMENDPETKNSLGLRLVNGLLWQIDGTLRIDTSNTTQFIIQFNKTSKDSIA